MKFTANYLENSCEYEIFVNGDILCHVHTSDYDIFKDAFKYEITQINVDAEMSETESDNHIDKLVKGAK
jgi:hypothetical protein